jgi:hypothetical protein
MAVRLEITPQFRENHGDEAAVDLMLSQVKKQFLDHIRTTPGWLRFGMVVSVVPEKPEGVFGVGPAKVDQVARDYSHDGLCDTSLRFVLENAAQVPYGPALEIGSFKGGTALALLALRDWPLLVTVDPYGSKDYKGGDLLLPKETGTYGDEIYVAHKCLLANAEDHAHFLMTGEEFLKHVVGKVGASARFWKKGEEYSYSKFGFAFVDGEHDRETVLREIDLLMPHMLPGGRVIIDNIDKDPTLEAALVAGGWTIGPKVEWGAKQALWVVG